MISQEFDYTAPASLRQALDLIANGAKPLAGGMSLIPLMKLRLAAPEHLVDLSRLPDLDYIREEAGRVRIGATTTHVQVETSALLKSKCPLLAEAAGFIGDVQVRNVGTIGGSTAHADPAADYPASLLALEAGIRIQGPAGEREVTAEEFFIDTFTTALEPGEIITEISVPVEASSTGTAYQKMVHPASGYAVVGVAVRVRKAEGRIAMVRVGVTGMAPKPYRAAAAEARLAGAAGSPQDVQQAAAVIAEGQEANSDLFASGEYRKQMARVYAARALTLALSRCA